MWSSGVQATALIGFCVRYCSDSVYCAVLRAFCHCLSVQDPLSPGTQANTILLDIRKRKGLKPEPSPVSEYEDKL